jgi:hypothetical protein
MTREQALVAAAEAFVAKVERGEVRSRTSYQAFKAALAMPGGDNSERQERVDQALARQLARSMQLNAKLQQRIKELEQGVPNA